MRSNVVHRILSAQLLLAAAFAAGCAGGSSSTPAANGTLSGKAIYANEADSSGITVSLEGPAERTAVTATDGTYAFSALPAGSYALILKPTAAVERQILLTAVVTNSAPTIVANAVFTPTGALSGTATFGAATGNAGILVVSPGSSAVAVTDDAGNFNLTGLVAGTADLIASAPGYSSAVDSAVAVAHNVTGTAPAMVLQRGSNGTATGSISGTVVLAGLSAQAGIPVVLQGSSLSAATLTAADGTFTFSGLADGQYGLTATIHDALHVSLTLAVQVIGGQQSSAAEFDFTPTGSIQGVANLQGAATGNAGITTTAVGAPSVAVTDDAGNYLLQGVPVGPFQVLASYPDRASATSTTVQVPWGAIVSAPTLSLGPPLDQIGQAQGIVTLTGATDASGVIVALSGPSSAVLITAADGTFVFQNLLPGGYTVTASASSTMEQQLSLGFTISAAAPFVAGEDFTFTPIGSAQGLVVDSSGAPAPGALVVAEGTGKSALADSSGAFLLSGLPVGEVMIGASVVGSNATPVAVAIVKAQTANAGTLQLSGAVQQNVELAGEIQLYGGLFGSTPDPSQMAVSWTGPAASGTTIDGNGDWSTTTPLGFYTLDFSSQDGTRSEIVPNVLAFPGSDGFVWQQSLFPLDTTPLEIEYGNRVVSGESVSPIVTNPSLPGDAVFTISSGATVAGQPPAAPGTLAMYRGGHVKLVAGAVPDVTEITVTQLEGTATEPTVLLQPGPQHSAIYAQGGLAYLALADGSIQALGVQINQLYQAEEGIGNPLVLGENVAIGGNVIALVGQSQQNDACYNGELAGSVYAVNVSTPSTVILVGCSKNVGQSATLAVSPDGRGVWMSWFGTAGGMDSAVSSDCDFEFNNTCVLNHFGELYGLTAGVTPTFSSDGSAAIMTSGAGVLLASSDGSSMAQLTTNANDAFEVFPAVYSAGPTDTVGITTYNSDTEYTDTAYLLPFQPSATLQAPVVQAASGSGLTTLGWNLSKALSQIQAGLLVQPGIPFVPQAHLIVLNGLGGGGTGGIVALPIAPNGAPIAITTSAYYDDDEVANPNEVQLKSVDGQEYLLFADNYDPDAGSFSIEVYDFATQATRTLATGVQEMLGTMGKRAVVNTVETMSTSADWIGWARESDGECFAEQFDVAGAQPIDLGAACNSQAGAAFSHDGTTMLFAPEGNLAEAAVARFVLTPLPAVQLTPVTIANQSVLTLLTGTFLSDDSIAFLGGPKEAVVPESQLVVKLDAGGSGGLSVVTLTNPNYSAKGLPGTEIAFNSGGMGASGQNLIDTGDSGYASIDLQIFAAGASGATDLGSVLTESTNPSGPGSRVVQQGVLADGTSLLFTRTNAQDVAALDSGIGTLVAATSGGWAARMLSRASGNYAMIPGTLELLGVQQRSEAPWGFQDGVYLLAPPAVAVPTEAQRKPSR